MRALLLVIIVLLYHDVYCQMVGRVPIGYPMMPPGATEMKTRNGRWVKKPGTGRIIIVKKPPPDEKVVA